MFRQFSPRVRIAARGEQIDVGPRDQILDRHAQAAKHPGDLLSFTRTVRAPYEEEKPEKEEVSSEPVSFKDLLATHEGGTVSLFVDAE